MSGGMLRLLVGGLLPVVHAPGVDKALLDSGRTSVVASYRRKAVPIVPWHANVALF